LESALTRNPNDPELRHYLGVAYVRAGEAEKGRAQFEEAIRLAPDDDESFVWLAEQACGARRLQEAYALAKKALELNPWAASPHDILAAIYMQQGLLAKAHEELLLAVAANRRDQVALKWLGRLGAATTQIREKAAAQKEKPSQPKRPSSRQTKKKP